MSDRDDMRLPEGKSCTDCTNYRRCLAFIGAAHINDKSTHCDWAPSRFRDRAAPPAKESGRG